MPWRSRPSGCSLPVDGSRYGPGEHPPRGSSSEWPSRTRDSVWHRIFFSGPQGPLRSGWRILRFAALFIALLFIGEILLVQSGIIDPAAPMDGNAIFWQGLVTFAAAIGTGGFLLIRTEGRPLDALGLVWTRRAPRELGLGLLIGGGSLALVVGLLALAGWLRYTPDAGGAMDYLRVLGYHLVLLSLPAAAEEALFRGYPFQVAVQGIGAGLATLLFSAGFSLAHIANPNVGMFALLNIFIAGILLSLAYLRTRSLWFATAVHLGWNWSMASVFDLPVSGLAFFDTPLYEPLMLGPVWATGGAFGPEAGLAASIAIVIAILAVVKLPGLDESNEMRDARPLVDDRLRQDSVRARHSGELNTPPDDRVAFSGGTTNGGGSEL